MVLDEDSDLSQGLSEYIFYVDEPEYYGVPQKTNAFRPSSDVVMIPI